MIEQEIESITSDPVQPGIGMPFKKHPRIQTAIAGKDHVQLASAADAWYSKSLHHRMDIMAIGVNLAPMIGKQECWMATVDEFAFFFVGKLDDVVSTISEVSPGWDTLVIPEGI